MKTIVFSDTHLSDKFEDKKYTFLKRLIESADRVIINGDFWDGHLISFETFVNSPWKQLFPLLLSKKTVCLYGNHDRREFCDERVGLYSVKQLNSYVLEGGRTSFVFEHGNTTLPSIDERLPLPEIIFTLSTRAYSSFEGFVTRRTKKSIRFWGVFLNSRLKRKKTNGHFAVYGHTHFAEFDPAHKFADTGFIQHGLAQYLLIDDGVITPREEWYG